MTTTTNSELALGDALFLWDGRVLELFSRTGTVHVRVPVEFLSVKFREKGDRSMVNIGYATGKEPIGGAMFPIREENLRPLRTFIESISSTAIVQ